MGIPENRTLPDEMNQFVWERFPQFIYRHLSERMGKLFNDGTYLSGLWKWAFVLPPFFFLVGLFIGGTHITFVTMEVYTYSIMIMVIMAIPSVFSACLATWICIGYGVGDLLIYKFSFYLRQDIPLFDFILYGMVPRLIPVIYLYLLLVLIPFAGKNLGLKLLSALANNNPNRKILEPLLMGLMTGLIVYGWTQSVPLLIRPVYAWQSMDLPGLLPPLYESGWILSLIIGVGVMVRQFFDQVISERQKNEELFNSVASVKGDGFNSGGNEQAGLAVLKLAITTTLFSTFLLSGLYTGWLDALIFGTCIMVSVYFKLMILPKMVGWVNFVKKIPLLIRFLGGIVVSWLFYKYIAAPNALHDAEQQQLVFIQAIFKNILYTMLVSTAYYVFLFPDFNSMQKLKN